MNAPLILVISDDCNLRQTTRSFLERRRYHPLVAVSLAEAQRLIAWVGAPCVVLIDPGTINLETAPSALAGVAPIVALPVRTSASGVRRIAKKSQELEAIIESHCGSDAIAA
ncbi:MAG: hypothetical protein JWN44_4704 [Myxococcales bacterium]|nr:hypothetical protein [Myxococcales bacterium]